MVNHSHISNRPSPGLPVPHSGRGSRQPLGPEVWRPASVVLAALVMSSIDLTIVNVALNRLHIVLHASIGDVQWVTTGYVLAVAVSMPLTGWSARRYGTRPVFIVSLALFVGGSVACGFAWSVDSLVMFRVLQGLGGGIMQPVGQMILARVAGPARVGRVLGTVSAAAILAPILGPTLGGILVDDLSWRWLFFINVPLGIWAMARAPRVLRQADTVPRAARLDTFGVALLATGLPLATYGFALLGQGGSDGAMIIATLSTGLGLLAMFVRHALRIADPLLDLRLFRVRGFSACACAGFLLGTTQFASILLLPLYYQTVRGDSAIVAGMLFAPLGIGAGFALPLAGRLTDRLGGGRIAITGILLTTLGTLPMAFIGPRTSYWTLGVALAVRGVGIGSSIGPVTSAAYKRMGREQVPDATVLLAVVARIGGSIGVAVLAMILQHALGAAHSPNAAGRAGAYAHTFRWVIALTLTALLPAFALARRDGRRPSRGEIRLIAEAVT
jgi:EmrB/QacA subfamily drug resistance transporter